jgi:hypothetical protein
MITLFSRNGIDVVSTTRMDMVSSGRKTLKSSKDGMDLLS